MKKMIIRLLTVVILISCCVGCEEKHKMQITHVEPQISQMRSICELAVLECYYHTVAKYHEEDAEKGFLGIGNKDKDFWIEYSGIVELGVDISLVDMKVNDTKITITLPEVQILSCIVDSDSLNEKSYIVAKESAKVTAEDEMNAFREAEMKIMEEASANKALLANAQQRTQMLLEEYINNMGEAIGKIYTIEWVFVHSDDMFDKVEETQSEN